MKRLLFVVFILSLNIPLLAQRPLRNKVVLQDGTVLRGRMVDSSDSDIVRIKTADGRFYSYALKEVKEIGETPWKERRFYPFNRSRGVFFRPELGLGYSSSVAGSIALSTGIQFGPHYALYWGLGAWKRFYGARCHPIFIGNLFHFSNNKNSMFVDLRVGVGINVYHSYHDEYFQHSPFGSLGIGKSFGAFDVGLYISATENNKDFPLIFSLNLAYNLRKTL